MKLPIKIENGVASLNIAKSIKLTPRQLATLKQTEIDEGPHNAERYLYSLLGLTKDGVSISRVKQYGSDWLAQKPGGLVLERFKQLLSNGPNVNHSPSKRSVGEWIGVEIECFIPTMHDEDDCRIDESETRRYLREAIKDAGIPRVSVKDDGSLSSDYDDVSCEVTILFNSSDGFEPLQKVCRILSQFDCYTNETCGLHVHLDARHLDKKGVKIVGRRLGRSLPVLQYMVDKSRTNSGSFNDVRVSQLSRSGERYCAINLTSWFKFKTVEVRLHGGTTSFKKIKNWIELLKFLSSVKMPKNVTTFQELIDLGTPEHLIEYADKRITALNPEAWAILSPETIQQGDAA